MTSPATYTVGELAALTGVSSWTLYQCVRRNECPFPHLWIGKRLIFQRVLADRILGIDSSESDALGLDSTEEGDKA